MIGIYKIENKITKDFYIGSSNNIKKRFYFHQWNLQNQNHHSIILQRAFIKYGKENFELIILEECNQKELISREQYYLDTLNPIYNINKIADNCTGRVLSKESRDKISLKNKGKKHSEKSKKKMSETRLNNPLIFTVEMKEKISNSKKGEKNPMYGKTYKTRIEAVKKALTGKVRTQEVKDKISKANSIPIVQLDMQNNFIKDWISTMQVERELQGFLGNGITRCCRKQRKQYKNFIWRYKKDYDN